MAKKFGYNITHKRNRQIFGYGIPKAAIITIIGLILVGILYLFFSGGEDNEWEESPNIEENEEESDVETADRTQKVETTTPLTEDQQKNCPTLTIPIIDFTEKDLLGDTSQNEKLPPACANEVGASERRLAKLYSNVIKKELIEPAPKNYPERRNDLPKNLIFATAQKEQM